MKSLRRHFHFVFNFSTGCFLPWTNTMNAQMQSLRKKGHKFKTRLQNSLPMNLFTILFVQFRITNGNFVLRVCDDGNGVGVWWFTEAGIHVQMYIEYGRDWISFGRLNWCWIQICPGTIQRHRRGQVRMHTTEATKPVANNSRYHRTKTVRCVHCMWTNKYLWPTCNFRFMFNYKSSGFKASVCLRLRNYGKS